MTRMARMTRMAITPIGTPAGAAPCRRGRVRGPARRPRRAPRAQRLTPATRPRPALYPSRPPGPSSHISSLIALLISCADTAPAGPGGGHMTTRRISFDSEPASVPRFSLSRSCQSDSESPAAAAPVRLGPWPGGERHRGTIRVRVHPQWPNLNLNSNLPVNMPRWRLSRRSDSSHAR
jgi:hypothetical protein